MVQEVVKKEKLINHLDEVSCNINEKEEDEYSLNINQTGELGGGRSLLGPRLLFCSILLWSFLFIRETEYGRVYINTITQMITEQIQIEPVQQLVNKLTIVIQQMI